MRSRLVVCSAKRSLKQVPALDVATCAAELGEALLPLINPIITASATSDASFVVENVSVPPEVEAAIDKRSSMAAVGNLNDYVQVPDGAGF